MIRIVGWNVLVDGGLAERDEETEHGQGDGEAKKTHFQMEGGRPLSAVDHEIGWWIGEDERRRRRYQQGPIEHAACAVTFGKMSAISAENARRH